MNMNSNAISILQVSLKWSYQEHQIGSWPVLKYGDECEIPFAMLYAELICYMLHWTHLEVYLVFFKYF